MNTPYVKQFDKNGTLLNPIRGIYKNPFPNRRERRQKVKPMSADRIQIIYCRDKKGGKLTGKIKMIRHYDK
jgi:hypothetical protein